MLNEVNLTTGVECNCNFCTQFGFYIAGFPLSIIDFRIFLFLYLRIFFNVYLILFNCLFI